MPNTYSRNAPRIKLGTIHAVLRSNSMESCGTVLDLSRTGAFLNGCSINDDHGVLQIDGLRTVVFRPVRVRRRSDRWSAVEFERPLMQHEISAVIDGYSATLSSQPEEVTAVAQSDRDAVHQEILSIQSCRTRIFLAAVGSTAAGAIATGALVLSGDALTFAPLFAVIVAAAFFLMGVFATVEKARAINLRRGFLREITTRLRLGNVGAQYRGWAHLRTAIAECGDIRRRYRCPIGVTRTSGVSCRRRAMAQAGDPASAKELIPGLLSSFTTFSSAVYGFIYIGILIAIEHYLAAAWHAEFPKHNLLAVRLSFAAGVLLSPFAVKWRPTIGVLVCVFIGSFLFNLWNMSQTISGVLLVASIGSLLGALGWSLLAHVNGLQRGKHSIEAYECFWSQVLDNCTGPAKERTVQPSNEGKTAWEYLKGQGRKLLIFLLDTSRPTRRDAEEVD